MMRATGRFLYRDPDDPFSAMFSVLVRCGPEQRGQVRRLVEQVEQRLQDIPPDPRATHETEGSGLSYTSVADVPDGLLLSAEFDNADPDQQLTAEPLLRDTLAAAGLDLPLTDPPQGRSPHSFGRLIWALYLTAPATHPDPLAQSPRPVPDQWRTQISALLDDPPPALRLDDTWWAGFTSPLQTSAAEVQDQIARWRPGHQELIAGRGDGPTLLAVFGHYDNLALTVHTTDAHATTAAGALVDVAVSLDPAPTQAVVAPTAPRTNWQVGPGAWYRDKRAKTRHLKVMTQDIGETCALEPGWWHLLGPGHLERLEQAGATDVLDQLTPVAMPDGQQRAMLTIGQPQQWLPRPDPDAAAAHYQHARDLLGPLLATRQELRDATKRQYARRDQRTARHLRAHGIDPDHV